MAGGLTISTLNDSSGVLATQNGMSGIAKAWVNFNGSGGAIRGSFNVSSITVNGTGNYKVNFTTAMPDTNYMVACSTSDDNVAQTFCYVNQVWASAATTTYIDRIATATTSAGVNRNYVGVAIYR
jgi:hypothetical protein